jgi:uncharacterized protein YggE
MDSAGPAPQVLVSGEATLTVDPEIATLWVTATGKARDRQSALERCRAAQDQVAAVVARAGDAVETSETAGVTVYRERRDHRVDGDPVASVTTRVTVARFDALGSLVAELGLLDQVTVSGPSWRVRPDSPAYEAARLAAVRDAMHRARQYAAAFGAELTALLEVRDPGLSSGAFELAGAPAPMGGSGDGEFSLDLTPGRQQVHGAVEVRFVMSRPDPEVFRP